ncbi:MAG: Bax inhibitor-1/YccA family protein [Zoogloeaceae bacterium]|jgi:modulator of FtsH protease|nr:Bax inhibitor-1/YccA family protein [Zoogloeaceae bacterium]
MSLNDSSYPVGDVLSERVSVAGETHKVLRNTYMLLAMTLAFSAVVAGVSAWLRLPYPGIILTLVGFYGLLFAIHKCRNSTAGVALVFTLTGFMGYTLGPLISHFLSSAQGTNILMLALGGTAIIFFAMSAIGLTSKRDFGFMGNFLLVGVLVAFVCGLVSVLFDFPALSLAVSGAFIFLSSGLILYETNRIVRGGETNYVIATVMLYMQIYNLLVSLLHILSAFGGDD